MRDRVEFWAYKEGTWWQENSFIADDFEEAKASACPSIGVRCAYLGYGWPHACKKMQR